MEYRLGISLELSTANDEALIVLVGRGDRAAATVLIERHTDATYAQCYRMLRNQAAAEDATQEIFLRLWRHARKWKDKGAKVKTWLYRIAANYCLDQLRKGGRFMNDDGLTEISDNAAGPADQLAAHQDRTVILEALEILPERQRMAIGLCYLQEMPNGEAAELMGISVTAIESLLARARRQLRETLTPMRQSLLEEAGYDAIKTTG